MGEKEIKIRNIETRIYKFELQVYPIISIRILKIENLLSVSQTLYFGEKNI